MSNLGQNKQSFSSNNTAVLNCLRTKKLVLMKQKHSNKIKIVKSASLKNGITVFDGFDSLITSVKGVALGIRTADCCPILFYEPGAKIIAAVHAGWKGSLLGISGKMVGEIGKMGGIREKITCVIGPHICSKCYGIPKERQKLFEARDVKGGSLDLTTVNLDQLLKEGVRKENIEIMPDCTFHQNERFFSYRKNQKSENYGEMLAYIGFI